MRIMKNKKNKSKFFNLVILLPYFLTFCLFTKIYTISVFALEPGNVIDSSGVISSTWGDNTILNTNHGAIINWNNFNTSATQR